MKTKTSWALAALAAVALHPCAGHAQGTGAPKPWEAQRTAGKPPASATGQAGATASAPGGAEQAPAADDAAAHDPTDPNLARLLPFGLQAKPAEMTKPGLPMHTARAFKTIMENCLVMEEEASCSLQSGAVTDPSTGDAVVLTWIYAMNKDDKPIIVATVQGKPDAQPGLQVIYGGSPSDPMISRGDFIGALSSGARIEAMELLGCRENCVYGLAVDEHADLATWLRQGDAVGFRFAKDKHFRQMSSNLDGFAAAVEDLPMAARRRIDPGEAGNGPATGNKRTLPTDAPPGMAATAPRP